MRTIFSSAQAGGSAESHVIHSGLEILRRGSSIAYSKRRIRHPNLLHTHARCGEDTETTWQPWQSDESNSKDSLRNNSCTLAVPLLLVQLRNFDLKLDKVQKYHEAQY